VIRVYLRFFLWKKAYRTTNKEAHAPKLVAFGPVPMFGGLDKDKPGAINLFYVDTSGLAFDGRPSA
jgi:hypothetical protein